MGSRLSGLGNALYDSKRREFLGRDGAKWSKLGVFYFFFYLGLAGFFCAMLAVFMALTPRDHPYYTAEDSRMTTRSNPLSPGLGFRPQPDVERNLIETERSNLKNITQRYVDSLKQYLRVYYWNQPSNGRNIGSNKQDLILAPFSINNPGECIENNNYGYTTGRPCVLVKLNKIVDFIPEPLDLKDIPKQYSPSHDMLPIICSGEYAADNDNIGKIRYYSENGINDYYGSLKQSRFPYPGKQDRKDVYQAPYIWVQFLNPRPNVLINVICQAYGKNIDVDKKTGRGLTRFQIFSTKEMERKARQLGDL